MVGEGSKTSPSPEVVNKFTPSASKLAHEDSEKSSSHVEGKPSPDSPKTKSSDDTPLKYKKFYMNAPSWTFASRKLKTKNGVVGYYFSHCPVAVFFKDTEDAKEPCYVVFHDEDKPLELEETDEEINFIGTYNIQK